MNLKERLAILKQSQGAKSIPRPIDGRPKVPQRPSGSEWSEVAQGVFEKITRIDPSLEFENLARAPWFCGFEHIKAKSEGTLAFDTETTGLSGGAGTLIFLAGFSYWADTEAPLIETRQIFLSDFGYELDFMLRLNDFLATNARVTSYNGSSFDLPLVRTRSIMKGLRINQFEHSDALYFSRRLWKSLIGTCSLGDIERAVLGYQRHGDVPGFLIPSIYFDSLKSNEGPSFKGLGPVFTHHQKDTQSLLVLVGLLDEIKCDRAVVEPTLYAATNCFYSLNKLPISYRSHLELVKGTEFEVPALQALFEDLSMDNDQRELVRLCRLAWVRAKKCGLPDLRKSFIEYAAKVLLDAKAQAMFERLIG